MSNALSYDHSSLAERRDGWREALEHRLGDSFEATPVPALLVAFLTARKWSGSARLLVDALPYGDAPLSFEDMRNVLARLNIRTIPIKTKAKRLQPSMLPCLLQPSSGAAPLVVADRDADGFVVEDPASGAAPSRVKTLPSGTFYLQEDIPLQEASGRDASREWLKLLIGEFRPVILAAFAIAFLVNLLSIVAPLTIMAIYDQVIAKESLDTLYPLALGVAAAVLFEIVLRVIRAAGQAYIGAKLDYQVGMRVFEQILHLSPRFTERAPVGGQVTRIRDFDSFREIFAGPLASLVLDIPFTLLFIIALMVIAGPVFLLPIGLAAVYLLIAVIVLPELRNRAKAVGRTRSERYTFLAELMAAMRSVKQQAGETTWLARFRKLSADATWANYDVNRLHSTAQALSQSLMLIAGIATLGICVTRVLDDQMTLGALIATMMLVWRVLTPIQTLFGLANRLHLIRQSLQQLIDLIGFTREQHPGQSPAAPISFSGSLQFNRVSFRYTQDANPALLGVSFDVRRGEVFGIAGDSGAGKSTVAKLILGLYHAQAGSVTLDGVDLRQLLPITMRQGISYMPQRNHAFPGTIYDNIILADPTASMDRVRQACRMAGILHKIESLPDGFETRFRDGLQSHVPQAWLRQLALARAFLIDAPIYILDEPTAALDEEDERYFLRALEVLRGERTVIMISQRPSHMLLCDRLMVLNQGQVVDLDQPDRALANLQARNAAALQAPATS